MCCNQKPLQWNILIFHSLGIYRWEVQGTITMNKFFLDRFWVSLNLKDESMTFMSKNFFIYLYFFIIYFTSRVHHELWSQTENRLYIIRIDTILTSALNVEFCLKESFVSTQLLFCFWFSLEFWNLTAERIIIHLWLSRPIEEEWRHTVVRESVELMVVQFFVLT